MEKEKTLIEQKYDALFEKDKNGKALDEESFLNALINLESAGKRKLFRTLLGDKTKEEVREYLQTKSREDWEKIVGKDYLGKKMTISDVIDQYSKMVKNVFKTKKIKEAVKEAGIKCKQVDGVILPPEGQQRLAPGGSEGGEGDEEKKTLKFKQYQEKSPVLFGDILTVENGIYPGDMVFFEGTDEKNALRYTGYVAIQIPKLNKTIFINDMKGEATFVCDKFVSEEDMKKSKKRLSKELGDTFHSVSYLEDKKELWKFDMIDLIFGPENGSHKIVRDALMDEKGELTEKGKEWFNSIYTSRKSFNISGVSYIVIARKFGFTEEIADLYKEQVFGDLSKEIFGEWKAEEVRQQLISEEQEKIKEEQQKIRKELINEKGELTEKGKEWFSYIVGTRKNFHLSDNMGYVAIAGKFGIKRETPGDLFKEDAFKDLSKAIFGKDDEEIKQLQRKFRKKKK